MRNKSKDVDCDDKYKDKSLRFYDYDNHYDLIFADEFVLPNNEYTVITDIMVDLKDADKEKEIHIYINSQGGCTNNLCMVLQQLLEFEHRVTICAGSALSSGFLLFCCGHEKYVSVFSELMYHAISTDIENGKPSELIIMSRHYGKIMEYYNNILCMNEILTKEEIEMGETSEVWLTGKDLINRNVAKDYSKFKKKNILSKVDVFVKNEMLYKKENDIYVEYKSTGNITSYKNLIE